MGGRDSEVDSMDGGESEVDGGKSEVDGGGEVRLYHDTGGESYHDITPLLCRYVSERCSSSSTSRAAWAISGGGLGRGHRLHSMPRKGRRVHARGRHIQGLCTVSPGQGTLQPREEEGACPLDANQGLQAATSWGGQVDEGSGGAGEGGGGDGRGGVMVRLPSCSPSHCLPLCPPPPGKPPSTLRLRPTSWEAPFHTPPPSDLVRFHSAPFPLQLRRVRVQLAELRRASSRNNRGSMPDPSGPGSHAKGRRLYTPSTFVLFV